MAYMDGFLIPVRKQDRDIYRDHELKWWPAFKKAGALSLTAGWGDDLPPGKVTDFPRSVQLKDDETVVFCFILWPDRATRDKAHAEMMAMAEKDPESFMDMPFDGARMVMGGFRILLAEGFATLDTERQS